LFHAAVTGVLRQDRIARGQMNRDDPVARYLPKSVRLPTWHGKEITLRRLGLPAAPSSAGKHR